MFVRIKQLDKLKLAIDSSQVLFALVFVVTVLSYFYIFTNIDVEMELQSVPESTFQLYWRSNSDGYRESLSRGKYVNPKFQKFHFEIGDYKFFRPINPIVKLRLDPAKTPAKVNIKRIIIKQLGFKPILIESATDFKYLIPLADIESMQYGSKGLEVVTRGEDSQLELIVGKAQLDYQFFISVLLLSLVVGFTFGVLFNLFNKDLRFGYTPYFMTAILALSLTSSLIGSNLHLDEPVHAKAAAYYENHWSPPEICSPDTVDTYSVYGNSRLDTFEIVYLLAGKFSRLLRFTDLDYTVRLRLFNSMLLFGILMACILKWEYRVLALPLIISPQIWYTFSYFNSEAFSLFVLFFISWQAINPDSSLNVFLRDGGKSKNRLKGVLLGLAFGLTLLIKKNFYIFLIFLCFYFILKLIDRDFEAPVIALKRTFVLILIAISIFGARYLLDIYINGVDRQAKIAECKEKLAEPMYKVSTELDEKHPYLSLKARGVTLMQMFSDRHWALLTFASALGIYNHVPAASKHYYKIMFILMIGLGILICGSILIPSNRSHLLLLLSFLLCSAFLIGFSFKHSWESDFQAQGRYLFPIFSMSGILLYELLGSLNKRLMNFFIVCMALMGMYSYIFVFLLKMPKFS